MNEENKDILTTEDELEVKLAEIEKMRNDFALSGKYSKAKECKKQILLIQQKIKEKKKQDLEQQHIFEIENLEQAYQEEIIKLNDEWNEKFKDLEETSQKADDAINERQSKEMEDLYAVIEEKLPKKVKYSKEYLILENQEKLLVQMEKYDEAKVVRRKKKIQKEKDEEKWNKEKNETIKLQAIQKSTKHVNEKNVLKKKFETELDLMRKEKESQIQKIEKRFQNKKLELELQQKNEKILNENENLTKKRQVGMSFFGTTESSKHTRLNTRSNIRSRTHEEKDQNEDVNLDSNKEEDTNNISKDNSLKKIEQESIQENVQEEQNNQMNEDEDLQENESPQERTDRSIKEDK